METKDIFTIGFSVFSLIISLTSIYLSNFRKPKIAVELGPQLHIYYHSPNQVGFYLPVVFYNRSPTKAIVHKAFLQIVDTNDNNFALRWLTSADIDREMNYTEKGRATPFKIDGFEAISNALQFAWHNSPNLNALEFLEGSYELTLHVWTSEKRRPDISIVERFDVNSDLAVTMLQRKADQDNRTWYFSLAGKGTISFTTGTDPVDFSARPEV